MSMSVKEAIEARHSVRSFTAEPVSEEMLQSLLEAARQAPSSLNSQPWRFKVVTDAETRAWIASSEVSKRQGWLADAPAILVCCADLEGYVRDTQASAFFFRENKVLDEEPTRGIQEYADQQEAASETARFGAAALNVGLAVSQLMLRAVELGLGTCWVGMFDEGPLRERFGLAPEQRVVCLLAVGHPDEAAVPARKRKSLDDIVLK
ncbi:nitroreductase family protein [Desulfovibrio sp. Huiquan2017]|uniref:nitroreductase family protein n=1 Tax=Desulfovibrio sp. Huiquan2017 TaxID=2816861 RepID=UPI001A929D1C|nr:nitroreductase family protein [Desulfovibrio sp. Huiquan2017]